MRWYACGPEKADDLDDDTDLGLFGEREGHCGCLLVPREHARSAESGPESWDPVRVPSWALVVGGYHEGELAGTPLAARVVLHPQNGSDTADQPRTVSDAPTPEGPLAPLNWTELSYDASFEKDGASLTRWTADTALLFGGLDSDYERCATLHTVELVCTEEDGDVDVCVSAPLATTGETPAPRSRHASGISGDTLFIFGGETDDAEQTADLYALAARTLVWRRIRATAPGLSAWPSARLLCGPLVFVTADAFVLYGGARYVDGTIRSYSDGWCFDVTREFFTPLWGVPGTGEDANAQAAQLPPCNGHCGGRWWQASHVPCHTDEQRDVALLGAVFVGGKDASEGCDAVKVVHWPREVTAAALSQHITASLMDVEAVCADTTAEPTHAPHWRYTAVAIHCEPHGLLMVGGNCRHPKGAASYFLSF